MSNNSFKDPKGLKITRTGLKFKFEWSLGQNDYKDQGFAYIVLNKASQLTDLNKDISKKANKSLEKYNWKSRNIAKNTNHQDLSLSQSNYYPTSGKPKIYGIAFRVRAKSKKGTWHSWVYKTLDVNPPNKLKNLSQQLDSQSTNVVNFAWDAPDQGNGTPLYGYRWQYKRVSVDISDKDLPDDVNWSDTISGDPTSTGIVTTPIKSITEAQAGGVRPFRGAFRVKSIGPGGDNGTWCYKAHDFGDPSNPGNIDAQGAKRDDESGEYSCNLDFNINVNAAYVELQYLIASPVYNNGKVYPPSANWTVYQRRKPSSQRNFTQLKYSEGVAKDYCCWSRLRAFNDAEANSYSDSEIKMMEFGGLNAPLLSRFELGSDRTAQIDVTNQCAIAGSKIAVIYRDSTSTDTGRIVWVQEATYNVQTTMSFKVPDYTGKEPSIGVEAFLGTESYTTQSDQTRLYTITPVKVRLNTDVQQDMTFESARSWQNGDVPKPPTNIEVSKARDNVIRVKWDSAWASSNGSQVAWADHEDALYSTNQPSTFDLTNIQEQKLNIAGLEMGKDWYVWVRLMRTNSDGTVVYSPYAHSEPPGSQFPLSLANAPQVPILYLSKKAAAKTDIVKATWGYVSKDGTDQIYAHIDEVTGSGTEQDPYEYTMIKEVQAEQYSDIDISELDWEYGSEHKLVLKVKSASEKESEYSDPVTLKIAPELNLEITTDNQSIVNQQKTIGEVGSTETITYKALKTFPIDITITGAGAAGETALIIRRKIPFDIYRPDEKTDTGYEGEIIYQANQIGEDTIRITQEDLDRNGRQFDDQCEYSLQAIISDNLGQTATNLDDNGEPTFSFTVDWTVQAETPTATVTKLTRYIDDEAIAGLYAEERKKIEVAVIHPELPSGRSTDLGDTVDIYRLSGDRPEKIIHHGNFGVDYIDPYPTIGDQGGYRVVLVTKNGDYRNSDPDNNGYCWEDYDFGLDTKFQLIDFNGNQLKFKYNVNLDNSWDKRFTVTKYLGGGTQGDWEAGVDRTGSVKGVTFYDLEPEVYQDLRDLAEHDGICHLRTIDGTNIVCNINVSDSSTYNSLEHQHDVSLSYTRVDNPEYDGVLKSEWEDGDN